MSFYRAVFRDPANPSHRIFIPTYPVEASSPEAARLHIASILASGIEAGKLSNLLVEYRFEIFDNHELL